MNVRSNSISRLGDALFSTTQQKVLGLLYGRPHESYFVNQILRITGMGVHTIKRELDRMTAVGILTMIRIGNQHHYRANSECPIYIELLGIVRKTFGIADVIKAALMERDEQIELVFIYGSIAKAQEVASSDIDLMVVARDLAYAELMETLNDAEQSLGRAINPTIYDASEIKGKLKHKNAFLVRVMEQPKIWIKGGEDDTRVFG
jgi:predicted nucleotidyltransferase